MFCDKIDARGLPCEKIVHGDFHQCIYLCQFDWLTASPEGCKLLKINASGIYPARREE
jgi:hypothetical protein